MPRTKIDKRFKVNLEKLADIELTINQNIIVDSMINQNCRKKGKRVLNGNIRHKFKKCDDNNTKDKKIVNHTERITKIDNEPWIVCVDEITKSFTEEDLPVIFDWHNPQIYWKEKFPIEVIYHENKNYSLNDEIEDDCYDYYDNYDKYSDENEEYYNDKYKDIEKNINMEDKYIIEEIILPRNIIYHENGSVDEVIMWTIKSTKEFIFEGELNVVNRYNRNGYLRSVCIFNNSNKNIRISFENEIYDLEPKDEQIIRI